MIRPILLEWASVLSFQLIKKLSSQEQLHIVRSRNPWGEEAGKTYLVQQKDQQSWISYNQLQTSNTVYQEQSSWSKRDQTYCSQLLNSSTSNSIPLPIKGFALCIINSPTFRSKFVITDACGVMTQYLKLPLAASWLLSSIGLFELPLDPVGFLPLLMSVVQVAR